MFVSRLLFLVVLSSALLPLLLCALCLSSSEVRWCCVSGGVGVVCVVGVFLVAVVVGVVDGHGVPIFVGIAIVIGGDRAVGLSVSLLRSTLSLCVWCHGCLCLICIACRCLLPLPLV